MIETGRSREELVREAQKGKRELASLPVHQPRSRGASSDRPEKIG